MLTEDYTHKNISNIQYHDEKIRKQKVATISVSVTSVLAKGRVW